ncbi:MAG: thiol peroxidase [Spirochaetales bacterium]|nr:thiol peroxidase [Spirochaetales bacterium]
MKVLFKGTGVNTAGSLPAIGEKAQDFNLPGVDLNDVSLAKYKGKKVILNIFPSIDTGVCAASVRRFNKEAGSLNNTVVLCISKDLPFAQKRFCGAEGLDNVITLSEYRNSDFSDKYKVKFIDGPLEGLFSRSVIIIDENQRVIYTEQVKETTEEPDYEAALKALKQASPA